MQLESDMFSAVVAQKRRALDCSRVKYRRAQAFRVQEGQVGQPAWIHDVSWVAFACAV